MDSKRTTSEKKNMRFKEFTDIDSLRHVKVDEKPVKNYKYVCLQDVEVTEVSMV